MNGEPGADKVGTVVHHTDADAVVPLGLELFETGAVIFDPQFALGGTDALKREFHLGGFSMTQGVVDRLLSDAEEM